MFVVSGKGIWGRRSWSNVCSGPIFGVDTVFEICQDHFSDVSASMHAAGTVLQGGVATGDTVEIGAGREHRKVKSLQRFHEPCRRIACGDRAGLCVTKFAATGVERTWVSAPKLLRTFQACVCLVQRCRFYTGAAPSGLRLGTLRPEYSRFVESIFRITDRTIPPGL